MKSGSTIYIAMMLAISLLVICISSVQTVLVIRELKNAVYKCTGTVKEYIQKVNLIPKKADDTMYFYKPIIEYTVKDKTYTYESRDMYSSKSDKYKIFSLAYCKNRPEKAFVIAEKKHQLTEALTILIIGLITFILIMTVVGRM